MTGELNRARDRLAALGKYLPRKLDSSGSPDVASLAMRVFQFTADVAEFLRLLLKDVTSFGDAITSGIYTPTLTLVVNADLATAYPTHWLRVGDVVAVGGSLLVNATSTSTLTRVQMSLPVASTISSPHSVGGTAANIESNPPAAIIGDVASGCAEFNWTANTGSDRTFAFSYVYRIEGT